MKEKRFKNYLIVAVILSCFFTNCCSAQAVADAELVSRFEIEYVGNIAYPSMLSDKFIPTMCLVKFDIDSYGKVDTVIFSDSVEPLYKVQYESKKHLLKFTLLEEYCAKHLITNKTLIMPLYLSYVKQVCPTPIIDFKKLANYYEFNGKELEGNVIILTPVVINMFMQY